jgi:large subunit ribosomal protein L9
MKIILLQDIKKIGSKGDIVEVKEGQARNFLIPKKLAVEATKKNINNLVAKQDSEARKDLANRASANSIANSLNKRILNFTVKENKGKMFGSITTKSISDSLLNLGYNIDKRNIGLKKPISSLSKTDVKIKIYADIYTTVTIVVTREED